MIFMLKRALESEDTFVGRETEIEKLSSALDNKLGGTILLAGDRGSGKTSLIRKVLEKKHKERQRKFSALRLTRNKDVNIELPFIPKYMIAEMEKGEKLKGKAELTSLILRAIVQALKNENHSRRLNRLGLSNWYFRPVGYNLRLRKLAKLAEFRSIQQKRIFGAELELKGLKSNAQSEIVADLDLSDAVIEGKLRALLKTFSSQLSFVFIFDELDKLQDEDENKIQIVDMVVYLKNLFTQCGAHFIFVTTENVYSAIAKTIDLKPYSIEHTLFTDRVLLNNFEPFEFDNWIISLFQSDEKTSFDLRRLALAVSWNSRHHPYEALQILKKSFTINGDTHYIDLTDLESNMEAQSWGSLSTMQAVMNAVYSKYRKHGQDYYNRVLYKSLRMASVNLMNANGLIYNRNNALSLLYTLEDFKDVSAEEESKIEMDMKQVYVPEDTEEIIFSSLIDLVTWQLVGIEKALQELSWVLEKMGNIGLESTGSKNLLKTVFQPKKFTLEKVRAYSKTEFDLMKLYLDFVREENIIRALIDDGTGLERLTGKRIGKLVDLEFLEQINANSSSNKDITPLIHELAADSRFRYRFDLDRLEHEVDNMEMQKVYKFIANLNEFLGQNNLRYEFEKTTEGPFKLVSSRGAVIPGISLTINRQLMKNANENEFQINLVASNAKDLRKNKPGTNQKQYIIQDDWVNHNSLMKVISTYLEKIIS
jgi:hypothetical protein